MDSKNNFYWCSIDISKTISVFFLVIVFVVSNSCTISYKLNGALIDYSKVKSISIADFPNNAELVYPPLSQYFSETLRDQYSKQTRLQLLKKGGDMQLEGEIVGYQVLPMGIGSDSYATQTKIMLTINVRFKNLKNSSDDIEDKRYTASQIFDSNKMLNDVQDDLMKQMVADIVDQIFNDTAGKW